MKQIVDKLNKIAKKIDESVEIPQTDLIIDSLDAITKAYGGTPNDSNLIVDKLEDIYNNIGSGVSGNIEITENGENINVAPYATATVNVAGGGADLAFCDIKIVNNCGTTNGVGGDQRPAGYIINDNVLDTPFIELEDNTTGNIRVYYSISNTMPAILLRGLVETEPAYILTASENVGCTYMNNPNDTNFIAIILNNNETESSITITINAPAS